MTYRDSSGQIVTSATEGLRQKHRLKQWRGQHSGPCGMKNRHGKVDGQPHTTRAVAGQNTGQPRIGQKRDPGGGGVRLGTGVHHGLGCIGKILGGKIVFGGHGLSLPVQFQNSLCNNAQLDFGGARIDRFGARLDINVFHPPFHSTQGIGHIGRKT